MMNRRGLFRSTLAAVAAWMARPLRHTRAQEDRQCPSHLPKGTFCWQCEAYDKYLDALTPNVVTEWSEDFGHPRAQYETIGALAPKAGEHPCMWIFREMCEGALWACGVNFRHELMIHEPKHKKGVLEYQMRCRYIPFRFLDPDSDEAREWRP